MCIYCELSAAVINVFPPLFEIGQHMTANFTNWGERRKQELVDDEKLSAEAKPEEVRKVTERISKYRDRMAFLNDYQVLPRRSSGDKVLEAAASEAKGDIAAAAPPAPRPVRRASIRPST